MSKSIFLFSYPCISLFLEKKKIEEDDDMAELAAWAS